MVCLDCREGRCPDCREVKRRANPELAPAELDGSAWCDCQHALAGVAGNAVLVIAKEPPGE